MTSEVVVMNKLGIALASDSAATVYLGARAKAYHADKLFMLSNREPVGVMVYGNSTLMGVPWETILKMFRAELGPTSFDTLTEYSDRLISYLNNNDQLFPKEVQQRQFALFVRRLFGQIDKEAKKELYESANEVDDPSTALAEFRLTIVKRKHAWWSERKNASPNIVEAGAGTRVVNEASGVVQDQIAETFPGANSALVDALFALVRIILEKEDIFWQSLSGVVIAGFGRKQHFPAMREMHVGEFVLGKIKYRVCDTVAISATNPSVIKPFAQSDMVETFLEGISPPLLSRLVQEISTNFLVIPEEVIDNFPGVSKKRKEDYKAQVLESSKAAARALEGRLRKFRKEKHHDPILRSIEFLPKNELAHVAASLVNLSSFQKRMSISEDETVGGPIDVAVISKGDGFVWIDRKHYFAEELNPHYFRNQGLVSPQPGGGANGNEEDTEEGSRSG